VARILRENLRGTDTVARDGGADGTGSGAEAVVARFGGDEFVVLLPEADGAGAQAAAGRLVDALRDSELKVDGREIPLRISVGVALFDAHGLPGEAELLAAADRAMYEAKARGGNAATLL
jgi:diguanylate cyclase (GGDEF)-like protein